MVKTLGLTPALKWHGGKYYLAPKIVALMPSHTHYVEPFAGGLSVLLAKEPEGVSEVVNDIDGDLSNFWRVLQDEATYSRFNRIVQAIPFSEIVWTDAANNIDARDVVDRAVAFFVRCRQSLAGRMDAFASLSRTRTRRGMNEQASAWLTSIAGLPAVHTRLMRVVILNRDALDVIRCEDGTDTLFYLDPPYLHVARTAPVVYRFEMTEAQHRRLLTAITKARGKVMLSGYRNDLYDSAISSWKRHEFELPNNASGGTSKRRMTECVWCNF